MSLSDRAELNPEQDSLPSLSIITACLNRAGMIEDAIRSVENQGYPNVEHIVIDGGSKDGTLDVLARHPHLRVVSEPDRGMYDALNKGLRMATGRWIGILNSDDVYLPNALHEVAGCISARPDAQVILGDAYAGESDANGLLQKQGMIRNTHDSRFSFDAFETGFQINASFIRSDIYSAVGEFDTQYRIVGDLDFLLRLALLEPVAVHTNTVLYHLRSHDGSLTFSTQINARLRWLPEVELLWRNWTARPNLPYRAVQYSRRNFGNVCFGWAAWEASQGRWKSALRWTWRGWQNSPGRMIERTGELLTLRLRRVIG